jgi:poly-beta-1,6-N-acetyl-D-glucosamine synthase
MMLAYLGSKWQLSKEVVQEKAPLPTASVIIPFRNEAENLPVIFERLDLQALEGIEIIWVDDHSEDESYFILQECRKNAKGFHKLLKSEFNGKKAAITIGINNAEGEVILTTDADCLPPENWINRFRQFFQNHEIQLVAGPVMSVNQGGFFSAFQQVEWASILLVTQFGFASGNSITCSAANLAYRKSAFKAVDGYIGNITVPSGDDEFILKKIVAKYGKAAATYHLDKSLLMFTQPAQDLAEIINQRVRWASKWHVHQSWSHAFAAVFAFTWQITFLLMVGWCFGSTSGFAAAIILIGLKYFAEHLFLGRVLKDFKLSPRFKDMFLTSVIHPFFVIRVAFGTIAGKYTWKGRSK